MLLLQYKINKGDGLMIVVENECVGCPPELGCLGSGCAYYQVARYYCDDCDDENILYEFDGKQLCIDCVAKRLDVVEGSDIYV